MNRFLETVREYYVQVVGCCRVGNGYGVSNSAATYYDLMIKSFSPAEIAILIRSASSKKNALGLRIAHNSPCRRNLKTVLAMIDPASISSGVKSEYEKLIK